MQDTRKYRDTTYDQWVPFMLVISGVLFKIPQVIWGQLEGNLMASFSDSSAKTFAIHGDEKKKE